MTTDFNEDDFMKEMDALNVEPGDAEEVTAPVVIDEEIVAPPKEDVVENKPAPKRDTYDKVGKNDGFTIRVPNEDLTVAKVEKLRESAMELINDIADPEKKERAREYLRAALEVLPELSLLSEKGKSFFEKDTLTQIVETTSGKKVFNGKTMFKISDDVDELEGEGALRYISRLTGVGSPGRVHLWNSGISLSLDTFSDEEIISLRANMEHEHITLGTNTNGTTMSGDDYLRVKMIVEFVLNGVTRTNIKNHTKDQLLDLIRVTDIPSILAGGLASMYPSGYPLQHYCVNVKEKCDHVIKPEMENPDDPYSQFLPDSMLNFNKIPWVDEALLTDEHRDHMGGLDNSKEVKDVKAYQDSLSVLSSTEPALIGRTPDVDIFVVFKVPTLREYFETCGIWARAVNNMVSRIVSSEDIDDDTDESLLRSRRLNLLLEYSNATELVKHMHWIKELHFVETNGVLRKVRDVATLRKTMGKITRVDGLVKAFLDALMEYKDTHTVSGVGMTSYTCPSCGTDQSEGSPRPGIIPMNMANYFLLITELRNLSLWQSRL